MKLPQLSLRELFLLVALVAMGCGWWVDRTRQANHAKANDHFQGLMQWKHVELVPLFEDYLRSEGYEVKWDAEGHSHFLTISNPSGKSKSWAVQNGGGRLQEWK